MDDVPHTITGYATSTATLPKVSSKNNNFRLKQENDEDFSIRLAVKAAGLQLIDPDDLTV